MLKVYCYAAVLFLIATTPPARADDALWPIHYRFADAAQTLPKLDTAKPVRLLADEDFAPFSFRDDQNHMTGAAVELAMAACTTLKITCEILPRPFAELVPALIKRDGDAIIGGPANDLKLADGQPLVTRPYFISSSTFVARLGSPVAATDVKSLAGKRLGFVKDTRQAAFLARYYDRAALIPYENETLMFEALRTGGLDLAFSDGLQARFWLKGSLSKACCQILQSAIYDRSGLSKSLSMIVSRDGPELRDALDAALDELDAQLATAKIFGRYFPQSAK